MPRFRGPGLLLTILLAASCADAGGGAPVEAQDAVVDDAGRVVRLAEPPRRVISLIPSATSLLLAMGSADRLVARTAYDRDPRLAELPSVGGGLTPNLEALAALRPDLVIAWPDEKSRAVVGRLADLGTTVYAAHPTDLDGILRTVRNLGRLLGQRERADSLAVALTDELDAVRRAVAGRPRPNVFYVVWPDPPRTAGPGTFIHELIEIAGGRNVFQDVGADWPEVSLEAVVRRQPDVIVLPREGQGGPPLTWLRDAPGWRALEAVRRGRVVRVDTERFNRPGPDVAAAARELARHLHPDAFASGEAP